MDSSVATVGRVRSQGSLDMEIGMVAPSAARVSRGGDAGGLVRYWRQARGLSQMALALDVGVSTRHMSFVETGRSRPSRSVLLRIAERLEIPGREENALLEAAGHARRHRERDLSDPDLEQVTRVLRFLLDRHEPNSAIVVDRHWDIVMSNRAHRTLRDFFLSGSDVPESVRDNLLRLTFHPDALRRRIVNFHVVGPVMIARAERELAEAPSDRQLEELIEEIRSYGPVPPVVPREDVPAGLLLPIQLRKGPVNVRLFSVVSTIGAAIDVTLQELRIESFFPADEASEATLAVLLAGAATGNRDAASGTGTGRLAAKGPKTARGCFAFRSPRDRLGLNHLAGV